MITRNIRYFAAAAALAVLAPGAAFASTATHSSTEARVERSYEQPSVRGRSTEAAPTEMKHMTRSVLPFAPRSDAWMHWDADENQG